MYQLGPKAPGRCSPPASLSLDHGGLWGGNGEQASKQA